MSLLWLIAYVIYWLFVIIYDRDITDDSLKVGLYYLLIVILLYVLNLIRYRLIKWVLLIGILVPIVYLMYTDNSGNDFTLTYILQGIAPANLPLLPDNIWQYVNHSSFIIRQLYFCLIYLLFPLFYWYGLYLFSKRIIKILYKIK